MPPLDGVCGVLHCHQLRRPAVSVRTICDASGSFQFVDVQARTTAAAAAATQLPPMAADAFLVADGSDVALDIHVMVPVVASEAEPLSAQAQRFNVAVRARTAIGRRAWRRLVDRFVGLTAPSTAAPDTDDDDLQRYGVEGHRFVLAAMAVHNVCLKHDVDASLDDSDIELVEDSVDADAQLDATTAAAADEAALQRRAALIQSM